MNSRLKFSHWRADLLIFTQLLNNVHSPSRLPMKTHVPDCLNHRPAMQLNKLLSVPTRCILLRFSSAYGRSATSAPLVWIAAGIRLWPTPALCSHRLGTIDWAFGRFYAWAHELAHEDDLSDRWLANRAVCRVRGRSSAAPDSYREHLPWLQSIIHQQNSQVVASDMALAQSRSDP